ncbi:hypothetical protein ACMHYB_06385 [Sorangium sp. So ce1128]
MAHDLAHLGRRDGLWPGAAGLVQSFPWMQPINHCRSIRRQELRHARAAEAWIEERFVDE